MYELIHYILYSLHSLVAKESACNAGDPSLIPQWARSPGEGNGNPPVFLPGESHGQGVWRATVYGVARVRHNLVTKPPPQRMNWKKYSDFN